MEVALIRTVDTFPEKIKLWDVFLGLLEPPSLYGSQCLQPWSLNPATFLSFFHSTSFPICLQLSLAYF